MDAPEGASPATAVRGRQRASPLHKLLQAAFTLLLLVVIFGYVLPQLADWSDVADALKEVSLAQGILLFLLFILIETLKGAEQSEAIRGLPVDHAIVASEASTAISNVIPGPSGTAARLVIYRSWGFTSADFARGWMLTAVVNNGLILFMPSIALALYAVQGDLTTQLIVLALVGTALSIIALLICIAALRSEPFARKVGHVVG